MKPEKENKIHRSSEPGIDINDKADIRRWCREFQCNEMRLKNAIRAVGSSPEAVRKYMTKRF